MSASLAPALPMLACGLILPLVAERARNAVMLAVAVLAFGFVHTLAPGTELHLNFLGLQLTPLEVDKLSKVFGYVFTISAFAAFLFAYKLRDLRQHVAALFYIGSALGAVFAGDLVSLYVFWEIMAVSSTVLILARGTSASYGAGLRYVLVHLFGGLLLLAGIAVHYYQTGSIDFAPFQAQTLASWLILVGVLINASAFPFSSWLSDAYPESTITGGVILSAYTTKTAVYVLLSVFAGWEVLIYVGCFMVIYGIIYALLENDMRRILAYSITNQVGFMVTGAGIGTALAINGAAAHAFTHIIYKGLLWMSAGAVLYMTSRSKCTELGGLWKYMPWTMVLGTIGALAISGVPGTSGFTSKTLILQAAVNQHMAWPWLALEIASAGVFLHAGIKFPYFVFFNVDRGLRPPEAPRYMVLAMGLLAFFCIYLGVHPDPLYAILPYDLEPGYTVYKAGKVVGQMQLLLFSALVFFLFLPLLKRTDTIALEVDWFYRKGGRLAYALADKTFNGINAVCARATSAVTGWLARTCTNLPQRIVQAAATPYYALLAPREAESARNQLHKAVQTGFVGVGPTLIAIFLGLALLLALAL